MQGMIIVESRKLKVESRKPEKSSAEGLPLTLNFRLSTVDCSYRHPASPQKLLQAANRILLEVENGRRESRIRRAAQEDFSKMFQAAGAAGGNHRDVDGAGGGRRQLAIEAGLRAVRVHGREENLSGAKRLHAA